LAVAVEGRYFVQLCVEMAQAERQWQVLCSHRQQQRLGTADWSPEREDFTWLETAFCHEFLEPLTWFGGLDHEWRSGPGVGQGGFYVVLWSREPRQLWWQLREEFERQSVLTPVMERASAQPSFFA
jgi:hypothetical protein